MKLKDWIWITSHNLYERWTHYVWNHGNYRVKCRICGDRMWSYQEWYSPEECGWESTKHGKWICHRCLAHRNFKPYIQKADEDERKLWQKE